MMPAAPHACFDHIGGEFVGAGIELAEFVGGGHTTAVGGKTRPEHIGDQLQLEVGADGAGHRGRSPHIAGRTNQLGVGVADLVLAKPATLELVDEMAPRQTVVDHTRRAAQ